MEDFRRFFMRGLVALLPTLITLWLLVKLWSFLWETLGQHIIWVIKLAWWKLGTSGFVDYTPVVRIKSWFMELGDFRTQLLGVGLAVLLVYIVGLFVGNVIGRTGWRLLEMGVKRIPLVRAIYPAVKQVTDFVLADKSHQFQGTRVVAIRPHDNGIWSIGLITGSGIQAINKSVGREMVTVFIPSSPTAFSGYVVVVPREEALELPMTVEDAMKLLVTGGVSAPQVEKLLGKAGLPLGLVAGPEGLAEKRGGIVDARTLEPAKDL